MMERIGRPMAGLLMLVGAGWLVSLAAVWHTARQDGAVSMPGPAAAIIVPDSVILLENQGQTTEQSLRAAAELLEELAHTVPEAAPSRAVLVSDPFHMLRLGGTRSPRRDRRVWLPNAHEPHLRPPPVGVDVPCARIAQGAAHHAAHPFRP